MKLWHKNKKTEQIVEDFLKVYQEKEYPTEERLLPQTESELDSFMDDIIRMFSLPDAEDTRDAIATMILHLNQGRAYASMRYFADGVRKSLANKAAFEKLKIYKENREAAHDAAAKAELEKLALDNEQEVQNSIVEHIQNP